MSFPFKSLRIKVVLAILLPSFIVLSLFAWYASFRLKEGLDRELGRRLISVAQAAVPMLPPHIITSFSQGDRRSRTYKNLRRKLFLLQKATGVRRIYVFDRRKRSLLDTRDIPIGKEYFQLSFDSLELAQVFAKKPMASLLFHDKKGHYYKTGFAPILQNGRVIAAVAVEGSASFFLILNEALQSLFFFSFIVLMLAAAVGFWLSRRITKPLLQLTEAARTMGEGDLTQSIPALGDDEIGFLARTMEEMRKNILARDERMQMMLSGIAHEVRNPLGGMELFTGILREELLGDEEKISHLDRIQRELRYLGNVVTSFLDFARPTTLDKQPHDWGDFLFELKMLLAADLQKKEISLVLKGEQLDEPVVFDKSRLHQAMLNLLQNAIQASSDNSTIIIETIAREDGVQIDIVDSGKGIFEKDLEKIFEPFFTTKEKGTGLGLPLAKKFIESHGGTMDITSTPDVGTTISIWLPKNPSS